MTQYEQKTDSREFEVANPDQNMGQWSGNSPADAADIAIRLWGPATSDRRVPLTWKAESALVYMIADLVSASRGRIAEESPAVLAAHFDSCRQAVVAAKRIQTSILEFLTCRPEERIGGAILVYQPRTTDPTGLSGELVQLELEQAKPGQILLAENVSRRLRDLPGIEFMAAPEPDGDGPTGLTELIWTTPQRVARMQESVGDGTEPMRADAPPVGATLIVNSPIVNSPIAQSPNVDSPSARRGPTNDTAPVTGRTPIVKDRPEAGSRITELTRRADSSLTEELEFGERPLFTRTRVILGVVAVVLVAALVTVFFFPTRVAKPQTPPHQDQSGGAATTGTTGSTEQKIPATVEPPAKTAQPEPEITKPVIKQPATVTKPPADNRAKNKKETQDTSEQPPVVEESGNWSQSDIPLLLTTASNDMGDGKYDKARREYRIVLRLQPKNQQAIDGIKKIDKIQSDIQQ